MTSTTENKHLGSSFNDYMQEELSRVGKVATIRAGLVDDLPFIFSTWLRAYKYSSDFARTISSDIYYKFHHSAIERIVQRPGCRVLVCCDKEHPEVLFGYMVAEANVIHFTYVKKPFRMLGIGTDLLRAYGSLPQYITHLTRDGKRFLEAHKEVKYNPYML